MSPALLGFLIFLFRFFGSALLDLLRLEPVAEADLDRDLDLGAVCL